MTSDNLAILISPCLFRQLTDDPLKEILDLKILVKVTQFLLEHRFN